MTSRARKQTGKRKRGGGWDIVVDWVQPVEKRSKLEKELSIDSSFGSSLSAAEGRRSRRSNTNSKLNTSQEQEITVKKEEKAKQSNLTVAVSFGLEREAAFEHANTKTVISMPQPNGSVYVFARDINVVWRHGDMLTMCLAT